jgi:CTP-dependent riboflavin kinase
MTSRDIQVTIGRTREHTSRMLKKLFEDGLVQRDMSTKPFTYKITEKGLTKIGIVKIVSA